MKITVVDNNVRGVQTVIDALGICRGNECTVDSLNKALDAKPVPHMSVLEFGWVCLLVEGVSIKTRIQVLRSRLFSTMERSSRSIDLTNAGVIVPSTSKHKTTMSKTLDYEAEEYSIAVKSGESLEDASYLLPLAVETSFFMAANLRVWFEYFQKRLCKKHVQDEHFRLAMGMWYELSNLFPIMTKAHPCEKCGVCSSKITEQN